MKKHSTLITFMLLSSIACAQTEDWNGTYTYQAVLGENIAEDKMIIDYVFKLHNKKCTVTSQGYQTDEKIICAIEKSGNDLSVKFMSYENGSTKNIYDVEVYPAISVLFTLTDKKPDLITNWGTLAPDASFTIGEHFTKNAD